MKFGNFAAFAGEQLTENGLLPPCPDVGYLS
jgi:hypothetical protein